jgi:uncharacterized protein (TIGR02246 family)
MEHFNLQEIISQVHERWSKSFTPLSPKAMAQNYTQDAVLFGSAIPPFVGREAVQSYFEQLPKGLYKGVEFTSEYLVQLTSDVISMAGTAKFLRHQTDPLEVRITHIIVLRDGQWLIASHHVSPKVIL